MELSYYSVCERHSRYVNVRIFQFRGAGAQSLWCGIQGCKYTGRPLKFE